MFPAFQTLQEWSEHLFFSTLLGREWRGRLFRVLALDRDWWEHLSAPFVGLSDWPGRLFLPLRSLRERWEHFFTTTANRGLTRGRLFWLNFGRLRRLLRGLYCCMSAVRRFQNSTPNNER